MKWSELNIGKKIGIGFTLVLVLLLVFGVWNFIGLFSLRDQNEFVLKTSNLIYDLAQREIDHLLWVSRLRDLIDAHNHNFDIELDPTKCKLGQWLSSPERAEIESRIPELTPIIEKLEVHHQHLHSSARQIQTALRSGSSQASAIFVNETQPQLTIIRTSLDSISNSLTDVRAATAAAITETIAASITGNHLVLLLSVAIGTVMAVLITRSITKPIQLLTDGMLQASAGDLTVSVDYSGGGEPGIMVQTFNRMVASLNEMVSAAKYASAETSAASQTTSAATEELSAAIEQVATSATEFASSATSISEQTHRINLEAQETGELARRFRTHRILYGIYGDDRGSNRNDYYRHQQLKGCVQADCQSGGSSDRNRGPDESAVPQCSDRGCPGW